MKIKAGRDGVLANAGGVGERMHGLAWMVSVDELSLLFLLEAKPRLIGCAVTTVIPNQTDGSAPSLVDITPILGVPVPRPADPRYLTPPRSNPKSRILWLRNAPHR
jgi:hypothetical protein